MKILYVTSSMEANDFVSYATEWSIPLNPSNQNFHNKLIRSLAIDYEIEVISIRPFSRKYCSRYSLEASKNVQDKITWNYLSIPRYRLFKSGYCKIQIDNLLSAQKNTEFVVIVDTLSPVLTNISNYLNKNYGYPVIGVCTDSPSNISGTTKFYTKKILDNTANFDGYIALTNELNDLFNKKKKPFTIVEGIVENELPQPINNEFGRYFFFGGALMERYGIYDLIEAFKQIDDPSLKLLICGHHANQQELSEKIEKDSRIIYLGILPNKKVLQLEMNAIANINPRPFSEDLDRFSIPSKTIEYLSTGVPTISVKNSKLKKTFKDNVFWAKSSEPAELYASMTKVLTLDEESKSEFAKQAQKNVRKFYSINAIHTSLTDFIQNIPKK